VSLSLEDEPHPHHQTDAAPSEHRSWQSENLVVNCTGTPALMIRCCWWAMWVCDPLGTTAVVWVQVNPNVVERQYALPLEGT
jgi:hypothetical protein